MVARYGSPLDWPDFHFDVSQDDSKKINNIKSPVIIISSSGMVAGGRIVHHLMLRLPDPRTLCCSSDSRRQARGFHHPARRASREDVRQEIPIRAQVASLEQFSDHADTPNCWSGCAPFGVRRA